jgi:hypothetical protein
MVSVGVFVYGVQNAENFDEPRGERAQLTHGSSWKWLSGSSTPPEDYIQRRAST